MTWYRLATDPALADFVVREFGGARVLVRRGYEALAEPLAGGVATLRGEAMLEGGRQPHPLVRLSGGERVVVRGYRRGGMMRHLNRDRYFMGHRAIEEVRASERAAAAGVRTPRVVAAAEYPRAPGYSAALATLWVAEAVELPRWLRAGERGVFSEVGRQIAALHAGGVAHPDLNLRNVLVADEGGGAGSPAVYLLDFDRARLYPGPVPAARRARDLHRLARSARKLAVPVDDAGWAALRTGYGSDWPLRDDLG